MMLQVQTQAQTLNPSTCEDSQVLCAGGTTGSFVSSLANVHEKCRKQGPQGVFRTAERTTWWPHSENNSNMATAGLHPLGRHVWLPWRRRPSWNQKEKVFHADLCYVVLFPLKKKVSIWWLHLVMESWQNTKCFVSYVFSPVDGANSRMRTHFTLKTACWPPFYNNLIWDVIAPFYQLIFPHK